MKIFQFSLIIFDSLLAVYFLLRFNRYKWNEKPGFLILFPALLLITQIFNDHFDVLAVIGSITASYFGMVALKFKSKTKIGLFWSCILYFGTLMLSNSVVFSLFQLLLNKNIETLILSNGLFIVMCLISKSCLWVIVRIFIFLEEKNIKNDSENIQPMLINSIYNIVLIVVIFLTLRNDILDERYEITLVIIGIVISQIIHYYTYLKLNEKSKIENENYMLKQMNQHDKQYFEESKRQVDRIARINHDIKNHLTYIAFNIENKEYDKAKGYIVELIKNTDLNASFVKLTDYTLNFIINHKLSQAQKKDIKVFAQIEDFEKPYIEEFDLCILLCNILDNAIEAVELQKEKQIHIEIYNYAGYQTYLIKNTIEVSILGENPSLNTTKNKKRDHGYGFRQINDIINKYHGHIDIYEMEKYFCIKILIPAI
ncbi:MAG: GHKL domain-containing protein [Hungatella sp.]|jgi:heme/copper-type cytochrome/quinol oxidase subunit 4|nr:GHKL domain-containing protein [Hungatella sp.]